jgi:uncharacterized protein YxeA
MKQIMQLLVILAIIAAVIFFVRNMNQPAGYRTVRQETTTKTKYEPSEETNGRHHTATETYKKTVKPSRDGGTASVKEETTYKQR